MILVDSFTLLYCQRYFLHSTYEKTTNDLKNNEVAETVQANLKQKYYSL